jgi:hypothetical protein
MKVLIDEEEWYPVLTIDDDEEQIKYYENNNICSVWVVDVPEILVSEYKFILSQWEKMQDKIKKIVDAQDEV